MSAWAWAFASHLKILHKSFFYVMVKALSGKLSCTGTDLLKKGRSCGIMLLIIPTVELQWLEHLWDHENMFETGVVRINEC